MNAILKQVPTAGVPLQTHGISKTYAAHKVLENVDFELPEGAVLGLIGRNGAGKSTLIRILMGLIEADAGESWVLGKPSLAMTDTIKEQLGYVPQQPEALGSVFAPTRVLDVINLMVTLRIVFFASIFAPLMTAPRLSHLFGPAKSSGVAELALLPGFGTAAETRRALLHAAVYPLLRILAVALCVIAVLWGLLDGAWSALPIFALVAGNAALFSAGISMHAMAGHGLDNMSWGKRILYSCMAILSLLLVVITSFAIPWLRYGPSLLEQMHFFTNQDGILSAIVLAWTALLILLYVNFRTGWQAFQHRPHPFLLH